MATTYVCDCCQLQVEGLQRLLDGFAPPHIKEVCNDCLAAMEAHLEPIQEQQQEELQGIAQEFLVDRRAEIG